MDSLWCIRQVYWSSDCLHAGPSLLSEIPDVLMRFRYHPVALAPDIEKAFIRVQIKEADRDILRFLWIDDTEGVNPNIVVKRFNRVVFGVTSSPFLMNATIRHHVTKYEANDSKFVTDFLTSLLGLLNGGKTASLKHLSSTKKQDQESRKLDSI